MELDGEEQKRDDTTEAGADVVDVADAADVEASLPTRSRPRRRWPLLVALVLVVAIVAAVVVAVTGGGGESYPKAWDPRVRDLVSFVEKERGLTFEHPVEVQFLSEAAFKREVTKHDALDAKDRARLDSAEAMLRAVGLIDGHIDLEKMSETLSGEGYVGFYRFEDHKIVVRGNTLDDERRYTLVHELTHALQDQRFDIGKRKPKNSGESSAFTAVVEADAEEVASAWRDGLSQSRRDALDKAEQKTADAANFKDVPHVFVELMSFPYVFGPDFLHAVVEAKGREERDVILRDPPTTEEQIVRPDTYLDRQPPQKVDTPVIEDGEKELKDTEGDFGMLSLLVVLSERIDFSKAWASVQGWAGDATVAFTRKGNTCVRTDVAFDDQTAATTFAGAFDEWAKGMPAKETRQGRFVRFESCDPGAARRVANSDHVSGIQGLALRRSIIQSFEGSGAPNQLSVCVADHLMSTIGADRLSTLDRVLTANPNDPSAAEVQAAAQQAAAACR